MVNLLVTGSAGHLGEALMRTLPQEGYRSIGLDLKASPFTQLVGTIADRSFVRSSMRGVDAVIHTATLHKPHIVTHSRQDFIDTNVTGTLNLLEEALSAGVQAFIFTSTTSVYGRALTPTSGAPAAWITEDVVPVPKNIYGVTKLAAENLCELIHRDRGLPCLILRTSRFFPEADDSKDTRDTYEDDNAKVNEFLYRRADIEDVVTAHLRALAKARSIGFGRYIISATTPFTLDDVQELHTNAPAVVGRHAPGTWTSTLRATGRCSQGSTASTSMPVRGLSWAGSRVTTSPTPSISSPAATISAVAWLVPSDQRVITTSSSKTAPTLPEPEDCQRAAR